MLTSLFGDLTPRRLPQPAPPAQSDGSDAATAVHHATSIDVVVDDSPTEAIRAHFAAHRQDLQRASQMVTLLDPSRLWAAQVLHALADAGGQPVQRLNVRERSSLRTLAVIERTLVPRRDAPALRVYHADIRGGASAAGVAPEEITSALAEGSQLTAVIVGAMQPHALVVLLRGLLQACHQPEWRCPHLVFILPPGAAALRQRILAQDWPAGLQVHALAEPLASAASVWNRVLEAWEATQQAAAAAPHDQPALAEAAQARPAPPAAPAAHRLPPVVLNRLLLPLARSEGLLACGIVDLHSGDLLATQQREEPPTDLAALAEALCAARLAHQAVATDEAPPEEILVTTGPRQTLLRRLPGEAPLGFVAVLDRQQANLALLRFKLLDAERVLG
ncbi:hypothetical protein [Pseudaquabacterium pictum]|uniref:Uncharacterized protein n=1 Tax=Pseudaquabacterium pictum TaxID=2315236 RepID=A0A480AT89_9BURK|nr:hypothetical protein [Rubrivivax pictus]GCL63437.1 hypothetical protein AQPW35_25180 [Rubrivivax pictus]